VKSVTGSNFNEHINPKRSLMVLILFSTFLFLSSANSVENSNNLKTPIAISTTKPTSQVTRRIQTADAKSVGVGQNIVFIEQLVLKPSTKKQILESNNEEAKTAYQQAIKHLNEAKNAQAIGDNQTLIDSLNKTKIAIFKAMRLSGGKVVKNKHKTDYKKRVKSTRVLLQAHKRVSEEKNIGAEARKVEQHVEEQLKQAQATFAQGNTNKALKLANFAYLTIKLDITRLRDGDTLVRSLNFKNKEEEYKYELERNNTHKVLVNVVLKEKISPQMSMLIKTPMSSAESLRNKAIQQATKGNFDEAIKTLEQSTQKIIRSIRMAGIYIPG